jgi:hypothetical protein
MIDGFRAFMREDRDFIVGKGSTGFSPSLGVLVR